MSNKVEYKKIIEEAFNKEGKISDCYSKFHNYSAMNALLAISQLKEPAPINTFNGWKEMGRMVKKGEKAIFLRRPIVKKTIVIDKDGKETEEEEIFFVLKNNWFGLHQTETLKGRTEKQKQKEDKFLNDSNDINFSIDILLNNLSIDRIQFEEVNGNCQGYAHKNSIAINPLAENAFKTTIHEIAHVILHCSKNSELNSICFDRHSIKEVEAEGAAYLVCSILGKTEQLEKMRGYIQHYLSDLSEEEKEKACKNIIKAVSIIMDNAK
jgi:antirestriction protein ArdC